MYVNYGLTVAQGIATYVIAQFFFSETFDLRIIPIIAVVIIAMASINIRLPRLLWIYMFKKLFDVKTSILAKVKFNHL
jgi:hypothetical protein